MEMSKTQRINVAILMSEFANRNKVPRNSKDKVNRLTENAIETKTEDRFCGRKKSHRKSNSILARAGDGFFGVCPFSRFLTESCFTEITYLRRIPRS